MLVNLNTTVIGDTIAFDGITLTIAGRSTFQGIATLTYDGGTIAIPAKAEVTLVAKRPKAVAFIPVEGEFYVCGVTGGEARPASEFVSGAYIGPVCKACASDFYTYGCD